MTDYSSTYYINILSRLLPQLEALEANPVGSVELVVAHDDLRVEPPNTSNDPFSLAIQLPDGTTAADIHDTLFADHAALSLVAIVHALRHMHDHGPSEAAHAETDKHFALFRTKLAMRLVANGH